MLSFEFCDLSRFCIWRGLDLDVLGNGSLALEHHNVRFIRLGHRFTLRFGHGVCDRIRLCHDHNIVSAFGQILGRCNDL